MNRQRESGFTLVEVMVASIIGVLIAAVAVGTLRAVSVSSEMVNENIESASEVKFAARRIMTDLINVYRDMDFKRNKFLGTIEVGEGFAGSCLAFYTVSRTNARAMEIEGDVYEVEYYLVKKDGQSSLMRRKWPNPDKEREPGGILTAIGEGIDAFEVRYFDGLEWQMEWDEDARSLPELVEVTIVGKGRAKSKAIVEAFVVNFARGKGGDSLASDVEDEESREDAL